MEVIEPLGKEILVNATIIDSPTDINLQLSQKWQGERGDILKLKLDLSKLRIFEPTSGDRIV